MVAWSKQTPSNLEFLHTLFPLLYPFPGRGCLLLRSPDSLPSLFQAVLQNGRRETHFFALLLNKPIVFASEEFIKLEFHGKEPVAQLPQHTTELYLNRDLACSCDFFSLSIFSCLTCTQLSQHGSARCMYQTELWTKEKNFRESCKSDVYLI